MLGRIFTNDASKVATTTTKKKKKEGEEEGITGDHLLEFVSRIVARSNITPRVQTDFCSGRKFPDGTECMCATFLENFLSSEGHDAAAAENLEEMYKFGHEAREKLLVSASKCKMCPPTEPPPPKKTKKKEEEEKEGKEEKKEEEENANS